MPNIVVESELRWASADARHVDRLCEVRTTRPVLPVAMSLNEQDDTLNYEGRHGFAPGQLVAPYDDRKLASIARQQFARTITPRFGRFYPTRVLGDSAAARPDGPPIFRCLDVGETQVRVDLNHPLCKAQIELAVRLSDTDELCEPGAVSTKHLGIVGNNGPGFQARWEGRATNFFSGTPFARADEDPDAAFYASPRLVTHIDSTAIAEICRLYRRHLTPGAHVLDLMSSWKSHLPVDLDVLSVTGLGMNGIELTENEQLTDHVVHDLNRDPRLPFGDAAFDAVVCTVSVEYLIQPFEVFKDVARVLRRGGTFVVTFSNRWFPPKVTQVWKETQDFEHMGLVLELFLASDRFDHLETYSLRGLPRPKDDKYFPRVTTSDPVFAVWGTRSLSNPEGLA